MAITLKGATADLYGLSTDEKPATAEVNTLFHELDTNDTYYFDNDSWSKVGNLAAVESAGSGGEES